MPASESASDASTGSLDAVTSAPAQRATTETVFSTSPKTSATLPEGWTQKTIGTEWAQRLAAVGLYPENFLKIPVGKATEEERRDLEARQHYFMGTYYLEEGSYTRAVEQFREGMNLEPENVHLMLGLVRAKLAARELTDAQATLDKVLEKDPQNVAALLLKAQALMARAEGGSGAERRELIEEAVSTYEKARKIQPRNIEVLKGLASAYVQKQDISKIIQAYRDIVAVTPRDTYSLLILANVLSKTGNEQEAITFYERVIEQRRGYINSYLLLGQLYEQMGRQKDGLDLYKRALLIDSRQKELLERFEGLLQKMAGAKGTKGVLQLYEQFAKEYPNAAEIQRLYANRLLAEKDFEGAVKQYRRVLELDPDNSEALITAGQLLLEQKEFEEAQKLFERAVDLNPDQVDVYESIAAGLLARDKKQQAIDMYKKAIELNPKTDKLYVGLAALYEANNQTTEGIELLERGLDRVENTALMQAQLGQFYEKQKDLDKASELYAKAYESAPNRPLFAKLLVMHIRSGKKQQADDLIEKAASTDSEGKDSAYSLAGEAYFVEGDTDRAIELYEKAYNLKPERIEYLGRLVQLLNQSGLYDRALGLVKDASSKVRPSDKSKIEQLRGDIYLAQKDFAKAIEVYRQMVQANPKDLDNYQLLVDAYNTAGKFDESFAAIRQAEANVDRSNAEQVKLLRGITFLKQKRFEQAERVFKDLIRSGQGRVDEYQFMLASVYMDQKRFDDAEKLLKTVIEKNPLHANALNALGYMYADRNIKLDEAEELIKKALELSPGAPHILDSMGWVYFRQGRLQEAREYLERAARRMEDAEIYGHLAEIYKALGELEKAKDAAAKALEYEKEKSGAMVPATSKTNSPVKRR